MKKNRKILLMTLLLFGSLLLFGCHKKQEPTAERKTVEEKEEAEGTEERKDDGHFHGKWIVDAEYAAGRVGAEDTIFVDSRGEKAAMMGTISGAIATTWQDWSEMSVGQGNAGYATYLPADKMSEILGNLGLTKDKEIIIIGEAKEGWGDDARLLTQILACGYTDVKIVDGGYAAMKEKGAATQLFASKPEPAEVTVDQVDTSKIVTTEELQEHYADYKILDVRSKEEYDGAVLYGEAKGGHLKGAIHFPYTSLFQEDGTLKSNTEIQKMLKDAGVEPGDKVAAYCTGGIRSAYMQVVLEMCGYETSYNYIESFWRWSVAGEVE